MLPLHESMLMGVDSSILSFVENADTNRFALLVKGRKVAGIVTLSDLQKLAVRPALFSVVTLVEMLLAEWIRRNAPNDEWLEKLSPGKQTRIQERYESLLDNELVIDRITATLLEEKILAATRLPGFPGMPGAKRDLDEIALLRNSVFHHHDFGETIDNALAISRRVRLARTYIQLLDPALPVGNRPGTTAS
jgi:hypothetical protein